MWNRQGILFEPTHKGKPVGQAYCPSGKSCNGSVFTSAGEAQRLKAAIFLAGGKHHSFQTGGYKDIKRRVLFVWVCPTCVKISVFCCRWSLQKKHSKIINWIHSWYPAMMNKSYSVVAFHFNFVDFFLRHWLFLKNIFPAFFFGGRGLWNIR